MTFSVFKSLDNNSRLRRSLCVGLSLDPEGRKMGSCSTLLPQKSIKSCTNGIFQIVVPKLQLYIWYKNYKTRFSIGVFKNKVQKNTTFSIQI